MVDIDLGPGYTACAINDSGEVVGWFEDGPFTRPFLWSEATGLLFLPWFRDHDTWPSRINNTGDIIGNCRLGLGFHTHALLWSRLSDAVPRGWRGKRKVSGGERVGAPAEVRRM